MSAVSSSPATNLVNKRKLAICETCILTDILAGIYEDDDVIITYSMYFYFHPDFVYSQALKILSLVCYIKFISFA